MPSFRIVQMSNTVAGGLYVVAEFRHDPADPSPFHVEEFRFHNWPAEKIRWRIDRGRVRIDGQWVWPRQHVDGVWKDRPDLDQAERETIRVRPLDMQERVERILATHGEKLQAKIDSGTLIYDGRTPGVSADTRDLMDSESIQVRDLLLNQEITKTTTEIELERAINKEIRF